MICPGVFTRLFSLPRRRAGTRWRLTILFGCTLLTAGVALGQQYDPELYSGMRWRLIGPHRAGRVTAVAGIPGRPSVYYMGTPGGGVWKTADGGRVWKPVFDDAHVASIGALALAPSDPEVVYVGTGEQTRGNGVYRSADGGATWTNIGLRETHYISSIIVDRHDPDTVLVGAFGDPGPGEARGVFKTTDGGKTWRRVLFKDETTGVADMCADAADGRVVYAATWSFPFSRGDRRPAGLDAQIYKSTDEGTTWQPLSGAGLPEKFRGRVGVAVAPGDKRVYAIMNQGFFRSDDAGGHWEKTTADPRIVGSGYFSRVFVDPRNADVVYVMQTSLYRSTDGGKSFEAYKGAPSGEDQHVLWIAPDDPPRMILGSDQGAVISLDGGRTWSSWFNQPTGQFYHVTTDDTFPYHVYAAQQDSGTVVVPDRSDFGRITYRDWFSAGGFESAYIAPDPANPYLIYSIGWYGTVVRMDRRTGQISTVFVPGAKYRYAWETPLLFAPREQKTLYVGMQHLLKTSDGAVTWQEISPDLTVRPAAQPAPNQAGEKDKDGRPAEPERGVIQTVAPSMVRAGEIWVGTSTGLIQLTRDGGATWQNVTPSALPAHSQIILIEASPLDAETAYVTASARNDAHPYIYRTRDGGKTWQKTVAGLPDWGVARVVREDPARQGLVYAGTETGAHVSFDGGDHWQPLQLNLPTTSVRDLAVHGSDLVAATFGRGLWILDDLSPLRQLDAGVAGSKAHLFRPRPALRVRWDNWQETPLPAETPAGQNPPDGAVIDYYLKSPTSKEITLEISDERGRVVRRYSSAPPSPDHALRNVPDYWFAPPEAGLNRFVWDLRYPHPPTLAYGFYGQHLDYIEYTLPGHAVPGQTPRDQPQGPLAAPGNYEVVLRVEGKTYRQPLVINLDPRVRVTREELAAQLDLARQMCDWMAVSYSAYNEVGSLRAALAERRKSLTGDAPAKEAADALTALEKGLGEIQEGTEAAPGFGPVNRNLARLLTMIESGDMRPATSAREATGDACQSLKKDLVRWRRVTAESLPNLNRLLLLRKIAPLPVAGAPAGDPACIN